MNRKLRSTRYLGILMLLMPVSWSVVGAQSGITHHYTFESDFQESFVGDWAAPERLITPLLDASGSMPQITEEGVDGRALALDGIDDQLSPVFPFLLNASQGTIAHWLRPDTTEAQVAFYVSNAPLGQFDYDGFGSAGTALEIHTGLIAGQWQIQYQDGDGTLGSNAGGKFFARGGSVKAQEWSHVAATWDRSGALTLYANCRPVATQDLSSASWDNLAATETWFGRPSDPGVGRRFAGRVDDLRVFDRALSADELERAFCKPRQRADQVLSSTGGSQMVSVGEHLFHGSEVSWIRRQSDGSWLAQPNVTLPPATDFSVASLGFDGATLVVLRSQFPSDTLRLDFFEWDGTSWSVVRSFDDLGVPGDQFSSVDVDADWAVVGRDHDAPASSSVLLFRRIAGAWTPNGSLTVAGTEDRFAHQVALDGDRMAVIESQIGGSGRAHFYQRSGSTWSPDGIVDLHEPSLLDGAATGLALDGHLCAVSHVDAGSLSQGAVTLLERESGSWSRREILFAPDATRFGAFGRDVSIDGGRMVIKNSSSGNPTSLSDEAPRAYVYDRQPDDSWSLIRQLTEVGPGQRPTYHFEMAVNGGDVIIGGSEDGPFGAYRLFVYRLPFFSDGFGSGDASGWSSSMP